MNQSDHSTPPSDDDLITPAEVSKMVSLSVELLKKLRQRKAGPRFYKLSHRSVRYRRADVLAWLAERASPTPDAPLS